MALVHSVTQFLADIRQRSDNEGVSATDRFPDAEILGYINRSVSAFWRIMVESRSGNYQVATVNFNTVNGISVYSLQANFYRLLNVNITVDTRKQWMVPFDENERAALSDVNVGWSGRPFRYSLVGGNIEVLPSPTGSYAVEVRYVPDPPTLTLGSSFDCVNADGMNFIIDTAAKYMADKDGDAELSAILAQSAGKLEAQLMQSIPNRDQNFPPRIQDVRFLARGGVRGFRNIGRWGR